MVARCLIDLLLLLQNLTGKKRGNQINNKDSIKNTFNIQYSFKENVNENEYKVADIILDNEYGTVIQFISGGEYTYISYPFMEVDFDRVHNIDYRGSAKRYYSKK